MSLCIDGLIQDSQQEKHCRKYHMEDIKMSNLERLEIWYQKNCDGIWEHLHGVTIDTLDNPGWRVKIDLNETRYEDLKHDKLNKDHGDYDWIQCSISDKKFDVCGDSKKLNTILQTFFDWVEEFDSCNI